MKVFSYVKAITFLGIVHYYEFLQEECVVM